MAFDGAGLIMLEDEAVAVDALRRIDHPMPSNPMPIATFSTPPPIVDTTPLRYLDDEDSMHVWNAVMLSVCRLQTSIIVIGNICAT
jgi:hypothetical protein